MSFGGPWLFSCQGVGGVECFRFALKEGTVEDFRGGV